MSSEFIVVSSICIDSLASECTIEEICRIILGCFLGVDLEVDALAEKIENACNQATLSPKIKYIKDETYNQIHLSHLNCRSRAEFASDSLQITVHMKLINGTIYIHHHCCVIIQT